MIPGRMRIILPILSGVERLIQEEAEYQVILYTGGQIPAANPGLPRNRAGQVMK